MLKEDKDNVELKVDDKKLAMPEFKALWEKINSKSVYVVDFKSAELIKKAVNAINSKLRVQKIFYKIETGAMDSISSNGDNRFLITKYVGYKTVSFVILE